MRVPQVREAYLGFSIPDLHLSALDEPLHGRALEIQIRKRSVAPQSRFSTLIVNGTQRRTPVRDRVHQLAMDGSQVALSNKSIGSGV